MPFRDDLLEPISENSPGGGSLRYEPIYEEIKEARRQDDDLPRGDWEEERKTADYARVVKLAGEALATRSKDLQLAAWLTEAQLGREGFAGLREGLELIRALIERFWDHLHPQADDLEFRASPLSWVGQYLTDALRSVPLDETGYSYLQYLQAGRVPTEEQASANAEKKEIREEAIRAGRVTTPEDIEAAFRATQKSFLKDQASQIDGCLSALASLKRACGERFGDEEPNFRSLEQCLEDIKLVARRLLTRRLEIDPDPEPAEGAVEDSADGAPARSIEPRDERDAAVRVAAAAHFMQRLDPTNPASYLMVRGLRWGELRAAGGVIDPKLLAAPPTAARTRLKTLLLDGRWPDLLQEAEKVMATPYGRGWLDLQRYVLTACYNLGSEYDAVATSVLGVLAALLSEFPALPDLTLMDDTPTANEETRAWLNEAGLLDGAEAGGRRRPALPALPALPAPDAPRRSADAERKVYERALEDVRSGRPEKGIELLMRELEREKSERARFLRRSQLAEIMVDSGLEGVAMPILRALVQQIEAHRLEEWEEGAIVARPLGLLHRCVEAVGGEADMRQDLYRRICKLDPVQAISFTAPVVHAGVSEAADASA